MEKKDKKNKKKKEQIVEPDEAEINDQYVLKPSNEATKLSSSDWPLLLKNYESMNIRTSHYTPIPHGHSPL